IVVVADRDTTIGVAEIAGHPDRIFVGYALPDARSTGIGCRLAIAQDTPDPRDRDCIHVEGAGRDRTLGDEHARFVITDDLGDLGRAFVGRALDLQRGVVAEAAITAEVDRPDLQSSSDAVIKSSAPDSEAEHPPRRQSVAPRDRAGAAEVG